MGLVDPFSCCGMEVSHAETIIYLLEKFCTMCQTRDRDAHGSCKTCPVGGLIYKSKEYLSEMYISKNTSKKLKASYKSLQIESKKIEPTPSFNTSFLYGDGPKQDILGPLKWALTNVSYFQNQENLKNFFARKTVCQI